MHARLREPREREAQRERPADVVAAVVQEQEPTPNGVAIGEHVVEAEPLGPAQRGGPGHALIALRAEQVHGHHAVLALEQRVELGGARLDRDVAVDVEADHARPRVEEPSQRLRDHAIGDRVLAELRDVALGDGQDRDARVLLRRHRLERQVEIVEREIGALEPALRAEPEHQPRDREPDHDGGGERRAQHG